MTVSSVSPSTPQFQLRFSSIPSIPLAVRLVVLRVVRHEVVQREPVVAGDEVDARERGPVRPLVEVGAAGDARRDRAYEAGVAAHEAPDVVAEAAVPL